MTAIEGMQVALNSLGLKAVGAQLEGLLEQAAKKQAELSGFPGRTAGGAKWMLAARGTCVPDCSWRICRSSRQSTSSSSASSRPSMSGRPEYWATALQRKS